MDNLAHIPGYRAVLAELARDYEAQKADEARLHHPDSYREMQDELGIFFAQEVE